MYIWLISHITLRLLTLPCFLIMLVWSIYGQGLTIEKLHLLKKYWKEMRWSEWKEVYVCVWGGCVYVCVKYACMCMCEEGVLLCVCVVYTQSIGRIMSPVINMGTISFTIISRPFVFIAAKLPYKLDFPSVFLPKKNTKAYP